MKSSNNSEGGKNGKIFPCPLPGLNSQDSYEKFYFSFIFYLTILPGIGKNVLNFNEIIGT
jgi:hypothetical protein